MNRARLARVMLALAVALTSGAAEAQAPRLIKIGALTQSWGATPVIAALRDGLQELGYRENEHFVIGVRFTQGNPAELPQAARDLVRQAPDVIVASGIVAARAARDVTRRIPIVFLGGNDPVESGLVKSYARPGGNVTGIADLERETAWKRMEIFRELVPGLQRMLLLYDAANRQAVAQLQGYRHAARRLGLTLVESPVRTETQAQAALAQARRSKVEGIFVTRSVSLNIPGLVLEAAPALALPAMFDQPYYVEHGGLASYARSERELGRQAARIVDRIIKGASPSEIPVEQPTKFELVVNLKTARSLGIAIPQSLLLQATRVIE